MKIVNPNYVVRSDDNIFTFRKKEYDKIEDVVREMLIPTEALEFSIIEFGIKDTRLSQTELSRTLKRNFTIKLQKGPAIVDLSVFIPKLVDDNYIIISGRKKIPLFQLFDIPVVTRGKTIKIRTNVATMMIEEAKDFPYVRLSAFGKNVSLAKAIFATYGYEETARKFDLENVNIEKFESLYDRLLYDLKDFYIGFEDEHDGFIKELGKEIAPHYDHRTKGEDFVYALDLVLKVDVMSKKFFKTNSILEEIVDVLKNGGYDDTDVRNKRIRCFEYAILSKIAKSIFDLCTSNRNARTVKFSTNSKQIITDCNVSDIVQFDFSINPIEELTKLSRISILGPGGFNRDNVPKYLRDISPSMFGRICAVDTPDRDNCGILQNLLPNVKLDENMRFTEEDLKEQPISIPVAMVPFLENNDQTRLQMSSSQMRQAIMLADFERANIQSGCEGLYTDYTQFIKRARKNGQIVYKDSSKIIVVYDDKDFDVIDIGVKKIYVENLDFPNICVKVGDKVKKGDIIVESDFCRDGDISIGKNLLTAIMIYHGYNYEDGIVISDRLVDGFRSVHYTDLSFTIPPDKVLLSLTKDGYSPLPIPPIQKITEILGIQKPEGEKELDAKNRYIYVDKDKPYALLKRIPNGPNDFYSLFEENVSLTPKKSVLIYEVNIYPNEWNTNIPQYDEWVKKTFEKQKKREEKIQEILLQHLPKQAALQYIKDHNLDKFSETGKFKIKGERINGIYVEVNAMYTRPIQVGDKIGNRHGNKGVISKIVPHNQMPRMEDGRHVDICINPLGIISRMNIGQLFELELAMSLNDLKVNVKKMLHNKESQDVIKKYLVDYFKLIDCTNGNWYSRQFEDQLPKKVTDKFADDLFLIQPPFESTKVEQILEAMKYTGTPETYKLYDPTMGQYLENEVAVGFMYFFRMVHIAESKIAARGIASYAKRTLQPLGGRKNKGGQRCGEMETACLIAHDGLKNLHEFLTTKSDCIDLKNEYLRKMIESDFVKDPKENISMEPESVKLLNSYLTVIGVEK